MRVRSEETATDALYAQTSAAPAGAWAGGGPSGATVRHSPQRSAGGRFFSSAQPAPKRYRKEEPRECGGGRRKHKRKGRGIGPHPPWRCETGAKGSRRIN